MPLPRYSAEQIAARAKSLYEEHIRAQVEPDNAGKVVVIDIETGAFEVDADHLAAAQRARARRPGAALFALRIGRPALGRIGFGPARNREAMAAPHDAQ